MGGSTGASAGRGRRRMITEINVTPMVDIMLVLLIIFMVTTTTLVHDALEVKLPEAATGTSKALGLLSIVIDAKNRVHLNGSRATSDEIRTYIRSQRRDNARLEAIIAADKSVPHGSVVSVIDLVRSEGVSKFAITVLRKEKAK